MKIRLAVCVILAAGFGSAWAVGFQSAASKPAAAPSAAARSPSIQLAVVGFQAGDGTDPRDAWLATAAEEMLAWRLRRAPGLTVIPTVRSYQTRQDYPDAKTGAPRDWPEIARLLGGKFYLTGTARGRPEEVSLELRLFDAARPQQPVHQITLPKVRLFDALDHATRWALETLRVPPPAENLSKILYAAPASPTALEYYAKATLAARANQIREAGNYATEALEYDAGFRPALLLLAQLELRFVAAARPRAATRLRVLNEIARRAGDPLDRVEAELAQGLLTHQAGGFDAALLRYRSALEFAVEADDAYGQLAALSSLCDLHLTWRPQTPLSDEDRKRFERQNLERAAEWQEAALEMLTTLGDLVAEASSTNKLALIYEQLGRFDEALALHQRTLAAARQTGSARDQASAWMFIGQLHRRRQNWPAAQEALNQCLTLTTDATRPTAHIALADLYQATSQPAQALEQYEKAYEAIRNNTELLPSQLACLRAMAELRLKLGQRSQALMTLQEALDLAHVLELPVEKEIRDQLERWKRGAP